jgi:DNA polymerase III subunit beta
MLFLSSHRDALLGPLQTVSGIIEKKQARPILSNVLLERKEGVLHFVATDGEIQMRTHRAVDGAQETQAITVFAKKFQDILRALPDGVQITLSLEENRLLLRAGKSRFQLQTLPAEDFPAIPSPVDTRIRFSVQQGQFKKQLAHVVYAMAQQDVRYYLNGLLLVWSGNEVHVVATDSHRLAVSSSRIDMHAPQKTEVIIPRKTVLELVRQLSDSEASLEITLASNQVIFNFGETEFISKLIDGRFPDYQRVIPASPPFTLLLSRVPLLEAVQRTAILTTEKFRGVRVILSPGELKLVSSNTEHEEAQEELEVDYQGPKMDLGFNVTYLTDMLSSLEDEQVQWHLTDSTTSMLVTLPENADFKYVLMPMRI